MTERPQDEEHELHTEDIGRAAQEPQTGQAQPMPQEGAREPAAETQIGPTKVSHRPETTGATSLIQPNKVDDFRARWNSIQTGFVDQPRQAVENADHLVAEVIKDIADRFAQERNQLEQQWHRGEQVSTEDLRVALRHYREFFDRLLSM